MLDWRTSVRVGKHLCLCSALCASLLPALAQSQPDVDAILKRVQAVYHRSESDRTYEFERVLTERDTATGKVDSTYYHLAFKFPDKYLLDMKGNFGVPGIDEAHVISDGVTIWEWSPKSNQYRMYEKTDRVPDTVNPEVVDDNLGLWGYGMANYWKSDQVRILREETISFDGQPTNCFVIELMLRGGEVRRVWVEKARYYVRREQDSKGSTLDYRTVKLNEPLSDSLFKFTPPKKARRVSAETPFSR